MPEVEKEIEIELKLHNETLKAMLRLKEGKVMMGCDGNHYFNAVRKGDRVYITFTEDVCIEFDMSDYAPDRDEP